MLATQKPADAPKLSAYVLYPSAAIKSGTGPTGQASDTLSQVKLFKSCCNLNSCLGYADCVLQRGAVGALLLRVPAGAHSAALACRQPACAWLRTRIESFVASYAAGLVVSCQALRHSRQPWLDSVGDNRCFLAVGL